MTNTNYKNNFYRFLYFILNMQTKDEYDYRRMWGGT